MPDTPDSRVPWCEEHNKTDGKFGVCLACALRNLTYALTNIDKLVDPHYDGHPNGCCSYELDYNEETVVERVAKFIKLPPVIAAMLATAPPDVMASDWFQKVVLPYTHEACGSPLEAPAWGVQFEEMGEDILAVFTVDNQYFTLARGKKSDVDERTHVRFLAQMFLKAMERLGLRPRGELRPSFSEPEERESTHACEA